jgi:hypothetical protein
VDTVAFPAAGLTTARKTREIAKFCVLSKFRFLLSLVQFIPPTNALICLHVAFLVANGQVIASGSDFPHNLELETPLPDCQDFDCLGNLRDHVSDGTAQDDQTTAF